MSPRVSVVMAVYNGERYLREAVESILGQTFTDFEFIIIDDGSQDHSLSILQDLSQKDRRIRIIENRENLGLSASLNKGIRAARGEYIARMDADDISNPERFEKQVAFMDAHPEVGVCGTWVEYIGDINDVLKLPLTHDAIHARLLFENALAHPSVTMRASLIRRENLYYDEDIRYAQDYELWSRAVTRTKLANVGRILVQHRTHSQRVGAKYGRKQQEVHDRVHRRLLEDLGVDYTDDDIWLHQHICTHRYGDDVDFLERTQRWLKLLSASNRTRRAIPPEIMEAELSMVWARVCRQVPLHPVRIFAYILFHPLDFRGWAGVKGVLARIWPLFG